MRCMDTFKRNNYLNDCVYILNIKTENTIGATTKNNPPNAISVLLKSIRELTTIPERTAPMDTSTTMVTSLSPKSIGDAI